MIEQIKGCPFCGLDTKMSFNFEHQRYYLRCQDCVSNFTWKTKEEATVAWNHRPIEDKLQARIDELEKQRDMYKKANEKILSEKAKQEDHCFIAGRRSKNDELALENKQLQEQLSRAEECLKSVANYDTYYSTEQGVMDCINLADEYFKQKEEVKGE